MNEYTISIHKPGGKLRRAAVVRGDRRVLAQAIIALGNGDTPVVREVNGNKVRVPLTVLGERAGIAIKVSA